MHFHLDWAQNRKLLHLNLYFFYREQYNSDLTTLKQIKHIVSIMEMYREIKYGFPPCDKHGDDCFTVI